LGTAVEPRWPASASRRQVHDGQFDDARLALAVARAAADPGAAMANSVRVERFVQ
jgi:glycerol-3-phosphate dehydrogenase